MPGWLRVLLWVGGGLALIIGFFRWRYIDFYTVPETSGDAHVWANAPNLEPGDFVLVWRGGEPHVGDLVECAYDPNDANQKLVARVVAIGGEIVEIGEGNLRINRHRASTSGCSQPVKKVPGIDGAEWELKCNNEEIAASKHDVFMNEWVVQPEVQVPAGSVYLLSDNRVSPWAHDSRENTVGAVPADKCTRKLSVRLWGKQGLSDAQRRFTFLF